VAWVEGSLCNIKKLVFSSSFLMYSNNYGIESCCANFVLEILIEISCGCCGLTLCYFLLYNCFSGGLLSILTDVC
jgi:hypothetical protein